MKYKSSNKLIGCFRAKDISPLHACVWLLLLLLASCGETVEVAQPELPVGTPVNVTADLQVSICPIAALQPVSTRGEEAEESDALGVSYLPPNATRADVAMSAAEKEIKSAYVVQFDGTAPTSTAVWVSNDVATHLKSGSPVNCSFTLTAGVKNRVYVIANPTKVPTVDMTLSSFETVAYTVSTLPSTGLPMAAGQDVAAGETFSLFQLKSALARLTFTTNLGTLTLKGIPSAYSLVPATPGASAVRPSGVTYTATANLVSGTTYYVPANLSGQENLSSPILRCSTYAPSNAMYVSIAANSTTYTIYLGDSTPQDFNVVSNYAYAVNATINGTDGGDMRVGAPPTITPLDGDGSQTANCYIAMGANTWYSFNGTVMGNRATTPAHIAGIVPGDINSPAITPSSLSPASADVLWETWNTTVTPTKGSVVRGAYVAKGRVLFRTGSEQGNAVVAIYQSGESLPCWSWHIWRVNTDPRTSTFTFPAYTATSGNFDDTGTTSHPGLTMMVYNLGALNNSANDNLSIGLIYQWGRKDPMPGGADWASESTAMATMPVGIPVIPSAEKRYTIAESIQLPTTFLKYSGDWCSVRTDNLWGTPLTGTVTIRGGKYSSFQGSKSIYDPCPPGWRVPPGYAYANFNDGNFTWSTNGRLYSSVWFPASGYRDINYGTLVYVGSNGSYWTSTPGASTPAFGSCLVFYSYFMNPAINYFRAAGSPVRCIKE